MAKVNRCWCYYIRTNHARPIIMEKSVLLFDIDYTIFNTDRFKKKISEYIYRYFHLEKNSIDLFDKQYQEGIQEKIGINIKDYSEQLSKKFSLPPDRIFNLIMDNQNLYLHSLYPDTLPALSLLSKKHILGIFSQGYISFQMNKLNKMGILPFFDEKHIYIFPHKIHKDNMEKLPKNAVVIDDKLSVVEAISSTLPAILITRGTTLPSYKPSIKRLTEIIDILSS